MFFGSSKPSSASASSSSSSSTSSSWGWGFVSRAKSLVFGSSSSSSTSSSNSSSAIESSGDGSSVALKSVYVPLKKFAVEFEEMDLDKVRLCQVVHLRAIFFFFLSIVCHLAKNNMLSMLPIFKRR